MKKLKSSELIKIADEILNNKLIVVKTDTVMGIVGLNFVQIAQVKKRDLMQKQVIFVNNTNHWVPLKNKLLRKLIDLFWPGSLTIVFDGIAYRMPDSPFLLNLISLTGNLYSSSANISGTDVANDLDECEKIFADYSDQIILVDDSNLTNSNTPSTIFDLDNMRLIRCGDLAKKAEFQKILKKNHINITT